MLSKRLKQLRLARGLSLEALAAELGGIVTRQALLKYEQGKMMPSPTVANKLAAALGVKAIHLWSEPVVHAEFLAHRKGSRLAKREDERIQSLVSHELEQRYRLQELSGRVVGPQLSIKSLKIRNEEDAEKAAEQVRERWNLGQDPISSVVDILEDHLIHVIEIEADEKFDGLSAIAYDDRQQVKSAAVIIRRGVPADRQRLTKAHELGHLVLNIPASMDEETAAFRFGAAFLAPATVIYREVGTKRANIPLPELILLKRRFGISIQALLRRFRDLQIISNAYYRDWCIEINRHGWRKEEPFPLDEEKPKWLSQNVLRALSEGWITKEEAETILGKAVDVQIPLSLTQRRAFAKLSVEERGRLLQEQSAKMVEYYSINRADD